MVIVRIIDMPTRPGAFVLKSEDGTYNIYLSDRLSNDEKRKRLVHEYKHIKLGHLDERADLSVWEKEREI